jgi:protein-disulfide isomerase
LAVLHGFSGGEYSSRLRATNRRSTLLSRTEIRAAAFRQQGTPALVIGGKLFKRGTPVAELREAVARARAG